MTVGCGHFCGDNFTLVLMLPARELEGFADASNTSGTEFPAQYRGVMRVGGPSTPACTQYDDNLPVSDVVVVSEAMLALVVFHEWEHCEGDRIEHEASRHQT